MFKSFLRNNDHTWPRWRIIKLVGPFCPINVQEIYLDLKKLTDDKLQVNLALRSVIVYLL